MPIKSKISDPATLASLATLEQLLDIGRSLIAVRDLSALLKKIVKAAGAILKADVIVLYEYREDMDDVNIPPVIWGKLKRPIVLKDRGREHLHRDSIVFKMLARLEPIYAPNALQDWINAVGAKALVGGGSGGFVQREGIASSAAVRLTAEKKALGVLFINYRTPHAFSDEERKVIEIFAAQAATAIQNARLYQETNSRLKLLNALHETSLDIVQAQDLESLMPAIIERAAALIAGEDQRGIGAGYWRCDHIKQQAIIEYSPNPALVGIAVGLNEGVIGEVIRTDKSQYVNDYPHWPLHAPIFETEDLIGLIKNVVDVPIREGDRIIAVLSVTDSTGLRQFGAADVELLERFANLAAIAIQNARLLSSEQQSRKQADILRQISGEINSNLRPGEVAEKILDGLAKVVTYYKASVQLIDGDIRTQIAYRPVGELAPPDRLMRPISQDRLINRIVKEKQPLILSDLTDLTKFADWDFLPETAHIKSWVGAPLIYADRTIGLLTLEHDQPGYYTEAIRDLLISFSNQAAIALENANLFTSEQTRAQQLVQLHRLFTAAVQTLDSEQVLPMLVSSINEILGAEASSVINLYDPLTQEFHSHYAAGPAKVFLEQGLPRKTSGASAAVVQTRRSLFVDKAGAHPLKRPESIGEGIESFACLPLLVRNEVLGTLYIRFDERTHHFSEDEKKVLEIYASEAAVAYRNSRLAEDFKRQLKGQRALHEVGRLLLETRNEESILETVASSAATTLNCTHCTVLRLDEKQDLVVAAFRGNRGWSLPKGRELPRGVGIAGWVALENKSALVQNAPRDSRFQKGWSDPQPDPLSLVVAPIVLDGTVLGVISAEHDRLGAFDEYDLQLIETLSAQASIAVKNARLLTSAESRVKQLERLHSVLMDALLSRTPEEILPELVKTVNDILGPDASSVINLFEPDEQRFHSHYAAGPMKSFLEQVLPRSEGGISIDVVRSGQPVFIDDGVSDLRKRPSTETLPLSFACLPLRAEGRVLGTLYIRFDHKPHQFSDDEKRILALFADGASLVYRNAQVFEERIRTIREIGFGITAGLDLDAVLNDLLARTLKLMKEASRGEILLLDESKGTLKIRAAQGDVEQEITELSVDQGIVGWVARSGEPFKSDDVEQNEHFVRRLAGTRSEVAVPLMQRDRLIGVLNVEHPLAAAFTSEDVKLLEAIASQVIVAIENARLFKELDERARQLERLQLIALSISAGLIDLDSVLQLVVDSLGEVFQGTRCDLRLYDSNTSEFGRRVASKSIQDQADYPPRPDGSSYYIVKTKIPRYIEEISVEPPDDGPSAHPRVVQLGAKALAHLPLISKDDVIGVLYVVWLESHRFSENDKLVLKFFSDQAAIAIENARLYYELQGRAEQLVRLQEVAARMLAESDTPDKVLRLITNRIAEIFGAFSCTIRLYDPGLNKFGESTASESSAKRPTHSPRADGTTSYLLRTKQAIYAEDASAVLPNGQPAIQPENHAKGVEAIAYLPMLVGEELIGRLAVSWSAPRRFSENDKRLLDLFADQAAATIKMARLYSQLSEANQQLAEKNQQLARKIRDLEAVYRVSQQLTSAVRMNEQDILALIHEQTSELMDTENMYIALYDEATDTVRFPLIYVDGKPTQVKSRSGGKGRTEWIIKHQEPIFIETRDESVKWYTKHEGIDYIDEPFASWIGVPMMAGDKVFGVIATYHKTKDYVYTKDDQNVLELMASQAAIVLQNARMWEQMQGLSEDLGAGAMLDVE
jgi:GAF domain-containing protein